MKTIGFKYDMQRVFLPKRHIHKQLVKGCGIWWGSVFPKYDDKLILGHSLRRKDINPGYVVSVYVISQCMTQKGE